jgi:hypothetical protein
LQAHIVGTAPGTGLLILSIERRGGGGRRQAADAGEVFLPREEYSVLCEVSERLLTRTLEEVVKPVLASGERDFSRLLYLLEVNNKETVQAILQATMRLAGGPDLLEDLFFHMAQESTGRLLLLARTLAQAGASESFAARYKSASRDGRKPARIALLDVLSEFRKAAWSSSALAEALLDEDAEIRDAAGEALFSIAGRDVGYDPQDPADVREALVQKLFGAARL